MNPTFKTALHLLLPISFSVLLSACAVGTDFKQAPSVATPATWQALQHNADLPLPNVSESPLQGNWWLAFHDPVLNELENKALEGSLDLQTAALRFAQARLQRQSTAAQRGVNVNAQAGTSRQRISEVGASTRMLDNLGNNREQLAAALATPFTDYSAGFDASWELDLWGRISRSIEAADAGIAEQAALLQGAKLSLTSDIAQSYFALRALQSQTAIAKANIQALEEQTTLLQAQVKRGLANHITLAVQQSELAAAEAALPELHAQSNAAIAQIALLIGEPASAVAPLLQVSQSETQTEIQPNTLPELPFDLALGMPSEIAHRRPDILAAEAALHRATAQIGVAKAALYPSVRIGATFGSESYQGSEFMSWGSRLWTLGVSLDLPIFDHGRRTTTVKLSELAQQQAAITYQKTVLAAWKEIDEHLSHYAAAQLQTQAISQQADNANEAHRLLQARYQRGLTDYSSVLQAQRTALQTQSQLTAAKANLVQRFVAVGRAVGAVGAD
ncbi:MAG: efflux transporter outer membrane subunit [Moraxella sp.]|nr:efflux transporter outer membrane subunit [Moraxella sp.]